MNKFAGAVAFVSSMMFFTLSIEKIDTNHIAVGHLLVLFCLLNAVSAVWRLSRMD